MLSVVRIIVVIIILQTAEKRVHKTLNSNGIARVRTHLHLRTSEWESEKGMQLVLLLLAKASKRQIE